MELTKKQEEGLKIIVERYNNHEKYTVIGGYAGTGKSTLVKFAIAALNINPDLVAYATYTGKAAEVLRKKGNSGAMTLHKLLYDSVPQSNGTFLRFPKIKLDYKIVVVDEISMLPKSMMEMLLKHNVYVIFLGDPFQLPQIDSNESHDLLDHPHIFLDEIMRQAAESEIIQLSLAIREGKPLSYMKGNEVIVMPKNAVEDYHYLWADQIIAATNAKKDEINARVRALKGFSGLPQHGDKMICLRNYWDDLSEDGDSALVNGSTGILENPFETFRMIPAWIRTQTRRMDAICGDFVLDDGQNTRFHSVSIDKSFLMTSKPCLSSNDAYKVGQKGQAGIIPRQFAFGYCITCWKAQGSEWDKILILEERFPFDKKEHQRFLYTAITRASQQAILVKA